MAKRKYSAGEIIHKRREADILLGQGRVEWQPSLQPMQAADGPAPRVQFNLAVPPALPQQLPAPSKAS